VCVEIRASRFDTCDGVVAGAEVGKRGTRQLDLNRELPKTPETGMERHRIPDLLEVVPVDTLAVTAMQRVTEGVGGVEPEVPRVTESVADGEPYFCPSQGMTGRLRLGGCVQRYRVAADLPAGTANDDRRNVLGTAQIGNGADCGGPGRREGQ